MKLCILWCISSYTLSCINTDILKMCYISQIYYHAQKTKTSYLRILFLYVMTCYITWQGLYSCSYLTCWTLRNVFYCKCVLCRKVVIAILSGGTKDLVHSSAWASEIDSRRKEDLSGSLSFMEVNMKYFAWL